MPENSGVAVQVDVAAEDLQGLPLVMESEGSLETPPTSTTSKVVPKTKKVLVKAAEAAEAAEPAPPPKIRVTLTRDKLDGHIDIYGLDRVPPLSEVVPHLPKKLQVRFRRDVRYGSSLRTVICNNQDINLQDWADAIAEAAIVFASNQQPATAELRSLGQGAYLAMGDTLYKLSPVAMVPQTKALTAARRMIVDKAKGEAEIVKAQAEATAQQVLQAAAREKVAADNLVKEAKKSVNRIPPGWMLDNLMVLRYNGPNRRWEVRLDLEIFVESFDVYWTDRDYNVVDYSWPATSSAPIHPIVWVPIAHDGSYAITQIHAEPNTMIPHIGRGQFCGEVTNPPEKIDGRARLYDLKAKIEWTMRKVNFNSMVVYPSEWMPALFNLMPKDLADAVKGNEWCNAITLAKKNGLGTLRRKEEEWKIPEPAF